MSSERVLVIGASGLVGSELARQALLAGHSVLGVARRAEGRAAMALDLGDRAGLDRVLAEFQPTVVAVAAAYSYVDGCEIDSERSRRENVEAVRTLMLSMGGARTRVIYYSSDQVFDGSRSFHVESDAVRPMNVYARHKAEAEELVLRGVSPLVIRTAWVFGVEARRKNFVYRVVDAAGAGQVLKVPILQAGCPTWTTWLGTSTLAMIDRGLSGIVHLVGDEPLTKAEWARKIARGLDLRNIEVLEVSWAEAGQVAPRPARVVLRSERHELHQLPLDSILGAERIRLKAG
jgi:dTDP-4-dehydrorhamnose reductase